ncbi:MAG TPA: diguanylate cyclase, partial [Gammaproteobacteria bacterium]|nr:diguanylate cyclase [Gammaproteobacteria bacterium]
HLIPESEKQKLHLQIGRLLLKEKKLIDLNEELFSILNHFNVSLSLITDPHEKEMLAEYNFLAGEKAKGSSAYEAAKEYFRAALRLLESNKDHPLLFKIEKEIATMEFLTGELGAAEEGFRNLLKSDKPLLDLMEIYRLYCEMLSTNNRHQEALQLGLQALRKNYIFIPANPSMLHILWNVFSINRTDIKNHALNPMKSAEYRASLNLISQLTNSAYIIDQKLFVYLTCTSVRLSLKHGYTESGTFSYLIYTFFIMNALNLYEKALDFVHLYEKIKAKEPMPKYNARNYFVLGCMINPWRVPFAQCLEDLIKSYYFGRDTGDLLYCNYSNIYIVLTNFMAGTPLVDVDKTAHNSINFIDKNMIMDLRGFSYFVVEMLDMLTKNAFQHAVITDREQKVIASKNNSERAMFYSQVIKLCFFMNEYSLAIHYWKKFSEYQKFVLGMIVNVEATFYYLLSCIALKRNFVLSRKFLKLFKRWMEWCPDNFQSYALLLKAEQARIKHEIPLALKCYSDALISAEKQNALHVVGLINEHMGQFFLDLELYKDAKLHLLDAYYAYQNWGAMTKCALLKNQYPQYLDSFVSATTKTTSVKTVTTGLESIDILSLFKSAQMISSEMQLDKLLEKLLVLLLQSAGAERGALLTEENKHWYVQAEGTVILQLITLENKTNVETRSDLPHSLLRYVERTEEPLVLHNLTELEPYLAGDAYLSQIKPLSILVMPIMYKGTLRYLLYLENRTMHNAFTHQHIKILQLLSSQAAISIENAKLYYQATHDPLTRLANRTFLYQVFNMAIEKNKKLMIALLFFDLDGFKAINDTYGHEIGDELLLHVAKILKEEITIENLAARLGGDEFVVLLINTTLEQVVAISENLTHQLKQNVTIRNHVVQS